MSSSPSQTTLDADEIARFSKVSATWWDEKGPFKPLHHLNPTRIHYIRDQIKIHFHRSDIPSVHESNQNNQSADSSHFVMPFEGLSILDIGCGGGLVCEPLTRLGASVTGIDGSDSTIEVAKAHAALNGLDIRYLKITAEDILQENKMYDVVLALEIVEHVADVSLFVQSCVKLLKPGGLIIFSTLNRTLKSYLLAIVGAEYIVQWVPKGTHEWSKFLTPSELAFFLREQGLQLTHSQGMVFNPIKWRWELSRDMDVNYFLTAKAL